MISARLILFKNILFIFIIILFSYGCKDSNNESTKQISEFGNYTGYSEEEYDSWTRTSQYLTMDDSVKLAIDIIQPVKDNQVLSKALPVVWAYYRYHRAVEKDGKILSLADRLPSLQMLLRHGYVIVVVDARGTGSSFGNESKGPLSPKSAQHTYDITEWIAKQEWCDGNVGMFGHSYSGNSQFVAAAQAPPHLKAIFPSGPTFDSYEIIYPGGIFSDNLVKAIRNALQHWDLEADAVPVDSDSSGLLLKEARSEHEYNVDPFEFFKAIPYRDSKYNNYPFWLKGNLMVHLSGCNASQVPVYEWVGWHDFLIRDAFQWFVNLTSAKKITVGWWSHNITSSYNLLGIEQLRWFDYWLKGIENGIMDESPIQYILMDDPDSTNWHQLNEWPLPESKLQYFYFAQRISGNTQNGYYKLLSNNKDLMENQKQNITFPVSGELMFNTLPLEKNLFVIGHPVVTLTISTIAKDVDLHVSLQTMDESDSVCQVSKGVLRASHRKESQPPFNNMGLPFHRHYKNDMLTISVDKPIKLAFDLSPIAKVFKRGHRIAVAISCKNVEWNETLEGKHSPEIKIVNSKPYESGIRLPVVNESN